MVDRPDEDASAAEIARWMEKDFGEPSLKESSRLPKKAKTTSKPARRATSVCGCLGSISSRLEPHRAGRVP
jgi:hypothetical protein